MIHKELYSCDYMIKYAITSFFIFSVP